MKDVNRYKLEADTKSAKPIVNPDYTLTRPKRLNKYEKVNGMKVVKAGWVERKKSEYVTGGIIVPKGVKGGKIIPGIGNNTQVVSRDK